MKREDVSSSSTKEQPGDQGAPGGEQSMVERVARVIDPNAWAVADKFAAGQTTAWTAESIAYRTAPSLATARKVLEATREPTEAMLEAHINAVDAFGDSRSQAIIDWQAMSDAALSEPQ